MREKCAGVRHGLRPFSGVGIAENLAWNVEGCMVSLLLGLPSNVLRMELHQWLHLYLRYLGRTRAHGPWPTRWKP